MGHFSMRIFGIQPVTRRASWYEDQTQVDIVPKEAFFEVGIACDRNIDII